VRCNHEFVRLDQLTGALAEIIGEDEVRRFFDSYLKAKSAAFQLMPTLWCLIPNSCNYTGDASLELNRDLFRNALQDFVDDVRRGKATLKISLRLANITLPRDVNIGSFTLRTMSEEEVALFYHRDQSSPYSRLRMYGGDWNLHRVEASITEEGDARQLYLHASDSGRKMLANQVLLPFYVSGIYRKVIPVISDIKCTSSFDYKHFEQFEQDVRPMPVGLSADDVDALTRAHEMWAKAQPDEVLAPAFDRFVLAIKRPTYHPSHPRNLNWDKLVDYVIAIETVLLTSCGEDRRQELRYRFRLNGATLLPQCTDHDQETLFAALGILYDMRSILVHGAVNKTSLPKKVKKFISTMDHDDQECRQDSDKFNLGFVPKLVFEFHARLAMLGRDLDFLPWRACQWLAYC